MLLQTRFLYICDVFAGFNKLAQFEEHLLLIKLRPKLHHNDDGTIDISLGGNAVKHLQRVGRCLVDPSDVDAMQAIGLDAIDIDAESWLPPQVARVLGDYWEVNLRVVKIGTTPNFDEFTTGFDTYMYDVNYLLEFQMGCFQRVTPTERSQRDIAICGFVEAYKLTFTYGHFGAEGGEHKHLTQRPYAKMRPGGARAGSTRHERDEKALEWIMLMEKYEEGMLDRMAYDTVMRHVATLNDERKRGERANARWPPWRELPPFCIFEPGQIPALSELIEGEKARLQKEHLKRVVQGSASPAERGASSSQAHTPSRLAPRQPQFDSSPANSIHSTNSGALFGSEGSWESFRAGASVQSLTESMKDDVDMETPPDAIDSQDSNVSHHTDLQPEGFTDLESLPSSPTRDGNESEGGDNAGSDDDSAAAASSSQHGSMGEAEMRSAREEIGPRVPPVDGDRPKAPSPTNVTSVTSMALGKIIFTTTDSKLQVSWAKRQLTLEAQIGQVRRRCVASFDAICSLGKRVPPREETQEETEAAEEPAEPETSQESEQSQPTQLVFGLCAAVEISRGTMDAFTRKMEWAVTTIVTDDGREHVPRQWILEMSPADLSVLWNAFASGPGRSGHIDSLFASYAANPSLDAPNDVDATVFRANQESRGSSNPTKSVMLLVSNEDKAVELADEARERARARRSMTEDDPMRCSFCKRAVFVHPMPLACDGAPADHRPKSFPLPVVREQDNSLSLHILCKPVTLTKRRAAGPPQRDASDSSAQAAESADPPPQRRKTADAVPPPPPQAQKCPYCKHRGWPQIKGGATPMNPERHSPWYMKHVVEGHGCTSTARLPTIVVGGVRSTRRGRAAVEAAEEDAEQHDAARRAAHGRRCTCAMCHDPGLCKRLPGVCALCS